MKAMVLGANGLCGTSLVPLLEEFYSDVELILVDPDEESSSRIIRASPKVEELWYILHSFGMKKGDILIDLTPELSKLDVLQMADSVGISVINATCCEKDRGTLSLVDLLDDKLLLARYKWGVPHIVDAGMNPGNINALLGAMVEKHGNPIDITEWEMDSTIPYEWDGEGFATWSPEEFASEFCDESTWEIDGKKVIFSDGAPIENLRDMPDGNVGALCQHEEVIKWGWKYGCKSRYLYGYDPKAMEAIKNNIEIGLQLPLCRKLKGRVPSGGDIIGLKVEFENGSANASISADNEDSIIPVGSNATSYLVACGLTAAFEMLREHNEPGINWPDDYGSKWIDFLKEKKLCNVEIDA